MPIYEYRCESCEHRLEKLQRMSEGDLLDCPECKNRLEKLQRMSEGDLLDCPECKRPALKRLVSAAAFRLKGGGWYETDFKQDNKRNLAESSPNESSAKDTSEKKSSAGTSSKADKPSIDSSTKKPEAKPAAKSASKE